MSVALNEARRSATALRSALTETERNLSDLRYCLGGGGSPSELAKRLGVQASGLVDLDDDLRALAKLKPQLADKIEDLETKIRIAHDRVRVLEANEAVSQAEEAATVGNAEEAAEALAAFNKAAKATDKHLAAFVAAHAEMTTLGKKLDRLGFPLGNANLVRINMTKVADRQLRTIDDSRPFIAFAPGTPSTFATFADAWTVGVKRRIDGVIASNTAKEEAA